MLKSYFLQYLLLPIVVIVLAVLMAVLKQKNEMLNSKKLIVFILLSGMMMAIPGLFGFMGNNFNPWGYLACQFIYFWLGIAFLQSYANIFAPTIKSQIVLFQLVLILIIMALGGYLFALIFNLFSETDGGYVAATCISIFPLPVIFYYTYLAFIDIPFEIFGVWQYPTEKGKISFDGEDYNRLMVLELEFSRHPDDRDRVKAKAKAPANVLLGDWFKKFIDDYNEKFPNSTISYKNGEELNGWIFYCKKSFLHRRRLLDSTLSIAENKMKEHVTIVSKRVVEHSEERFLKTQNKLSINL